MDRLTCVGDFNGDGIADRILQNTATSETAVAFGKKDGSFFPAIHRLSRAEVARFQGLTFYGFTLPQLFNSTRPVSLPEGLKTALGLGGDIKISFRGLQNLVFGALATDETNGQCRLSISLEGDASASWRGLSLTLPVVSSREEALETLSPNPYGHFSSAPNPYLYGGETEDSKLMVNPYR